MKWLILILMPFQAFAQDSILSLDEYLARVKRYHPAVRQANLRISEAQAALLEARGGFDPKFEAEAYTKRFGGKEYYTVAGGAFSIPTWFGIEARAGFEQNDGTYLNPQNTVPDNGLASIGLKVPVGQGLLINRRMADLRKAKLMIAQTRAEQRLAAAEIIDEAARAYFHWARCHRERELYREYLENAQRRFSGIKSLITAGDRAGIDSIEAGLVVSGRMLNLENAGLKLTKARLDMSNFLWAEGEVPLELTERMVPEKDPSVEENELLATTMPDTLPVHPKLEALQFKIRSLEVERRAKANLLLPKVDLTYSWLSQAWAFNGSFRDDYRAGISVGFPLFLRRERGGLRLAEFKVMDAKWQLELERLAMANKLRSMKEEIRSLSRQRELLEKMVNDQRTMLQSEERLFEMGESSLFLINTREANLLDAALRQIEMENRWLDAHAAAFRLLAPELMR